MVSFRAMTLKLSPLKIQSVLKTCPKPFRAVDCALITKANFYEKVSFLETIKNRGLGNKSCIFFHACGIAEDPSKLMNLEK